MTPKLSQNRIFKKFGFKRGFYVPAVHGQVLLNRYRKYQKFGLPDHLGLSGGHQEDHFQLVHHVIFILLQDLNKRS